MAYVRPDGMTSFAWATRQLALVCALATAAIATFATVDAELEHRRAATSARAAGDHAGLSYLVGRQRQLVLSSVGGRSDELREGSRLTRDIQLLLAGLRARAEGDAANAAVALADSYDAAARASALALGSASAGVHRRNVRE